MLESYFTTIRFLEDFLKEAKVYVKSNVKEKSPIMEETCIEVEPLSNVEEKFISTSPNPQIINDQTQSQSQPVLVSNVNAANLQIISGIQARVQQYKCAMQVSKTCLKKYNRNEN